MEWLQTIFRALFRRRARTLLTAFGVSIGIFSVSLTGIISATGSRAINAELSRLGMDGLLVSGEQLTEQTLARFENSPLSAAPLQFSYADISVHGTSAAAAVWGIDAEDAAVVSLTLLHGRLFTRGDVASGAQVCLVDESFARSYYGRSNIVGKVIQIGIGGAWLPFTVAGVVETGGSLLQSVVGGYLPAFLYIPYTSAGSSGFQQMAVLPKTGVSAAEAEGWITRLLGDTVSVHNLSSYKAQFNELLQSVTAILELIAAISLLVASLSIFSVMLASVSERRREIGIKKSIGASRGRIAAEFFTEAVLLSAIGALIGNLLAAAAGWLGSKLFGLTPAIDPMLLIRNFLFAAAAGGLSGLLPALRAASLSPVEAFKEG